MVILTKPDTPMDDWHDDDDDSSVESDFQEEEDDGCGVVIAIDDMSVTSREFTPVRAKKKFYHAGSFVSVLSTESSLEIDTVPASPDDNQGTQNAPWDEDNNQSPPNKNGRTITTFTSTANKEGTTSLRNERKSGKKGLLQASGSSLNESCSSIKDLLGFGRIHEHAAYGSFGSSDEEESDDDDSFKLPANIKGMHIVRTTMNNNDKVEDHDDDSDGEQVDSLVDDSVVNMILRARTTDMKDQTLRAGKRSSKYSMRNRITPKVNGVTGDPLLNRFLDSRHVQKESQEGNQRATPSFLPGRSELKINTNDLKFDSIMRKTDSLNHVNKQGQRVVKTLHENHSASRRASVMNSSHQDALMERFLSSEARRRQSHTGSSLPTSSRGGGDIYDAYNGMNRVDAKARRLVGTRLGGN